MYVLMNLWINNFFSDNMSETEFELALTFICIWYKKLIKSVINSYQIKIISYQICKKVK
jgi:hypothetical protein